MQKKGERVHSQYTLSPGDYKAIVTEWGAYLTPSPKNYERAKEQGLIW